MKEIFLLLSCVCLTACAAKIGSDAAPIDASLPVCEQYFQSLERAAMKPKNEKMRSALLQTLENDKAAWRKYGEKEQEPTCRESLKRIQKMLND